MKKIITLILAAVMALSLPAAVTEAKMSGNTAKSATDSSSNADTVEKRHIKVGFGIGGAPYEYLNDNDEPDGYDIKAFEAVAELLPQYEFEFVASSFEDVMTQVASGAMQIGLNNSFWTPERAEKYTIPEEGLGACLIGLTVRKENEDCDTIEKCVDAGLSMVPVSSGDGLRVIIDQFNEEHPDKAVDFGTVEIYTLADFYTYVAEGRYDYLLMSAGIYETLIAAEDGELHEVYGDQLVQHIIGAVNTYSLMAPGEEQLAADVSEAIKQLREDGTLSKLQLEYTGVDAFEYLDSSSETEEADATEVRHIKVGFGIGGAPYEYLNDDDEPDGYDIKAFEAVAELLPQYEFEFVASSFEDVMTQVASGAMQIGLNNSFWTPERAEKYTIPEEGLGACLIGLTVRKENEDCDTIEKCVDAGLKMVPVSSGDGLRVIIDQFNEEHPDKAVDFGTVEIYTLADFYTYVAEGRYDYLLMSAGIYETLIAAEDGELHEVYGDALVQHIIGAVNTYSLMAPGEDQLAKDVSEAIKQLREDGTLSKLQLEYTGVDAFEALK